jgi:hypothetical protein
MKDILQDIVTHTHSLGFLPMLKITGTDKETLIESMAEDRSVVMIASTAEPVKEFEGIFGMPNLDKLSLHLKNPEYKEKAKIDIVTGERNGKTVPTNIHFENETGDFVNDFRFMSTEVINEKLKSVQPRISKWDIEFEPSLSAVQRLKLQAAVHSEETVFKVTLENKDLTFFFGDANTHAGSFVFQPDVDGKLKNEWQWPIQQVISILNLDGTITMKIADEGAMEIQVDSGLAKYRYILPAQSK